MGKKTDKMNEPWHKHRQIIEALLKKHKRKDRGKVLCEFIEQAFVVLGALEWETEREDRSRITNMSLRTERMAVSKVLLKTRMAT